LAQELGRLVTGLTLIYTGFLFVIGTREFSIVAAVPWNSLCLELLALSCSVQTFAQRLQKYLLISCYERIRGFSILRYANVLVIVIIIITGDSRDPGLVFSPQNLCNGGQFKKIIKQL